MTIVHWNRGRKVAANLGTSKAREGGEVAGVNGGDPGGHDGGEESGVVEGNLRSNEVGGNGDQGSIGVGGWLQLGQGVGYLVGHNVGCRGLGWNLAHPMAEWAGSFTGEDETVVEMDVEVGGCECGDALVITEEANGQE